MYFMAHVCHYLTGTELLCVLISIGTSLVQIRMHTSQSPLLYKTDIPS